jgi:hypothetical protein
VHCNQGLCRHLGVEQPSIELQCTSVLFQVFDFNKMVNIHSLGKIFFNIFFDLFHSIVQILSNKKSLVHYDLHHVFRCTMYDVVTQKWPSEDQACGLEALLWTQEFGYPLYS